MSVSVAPVPFRGWKNALRLANGVAELIATLDVGPRILSYTRNGGSNPFNIYAEQAGGVGESQWRNRGGHRLWLAPEKPDITYFPDNSPVTWEPIGTTGARLTARPEATGFQKQIDLLLEAETAKVTVVHRITRTADSPCWAAPWALSVMAQGGIAIVPQPAMGEHPRDLLPNRRLVLWPYTDLSDSRYQFDRQYFTLRQNPAGSPTKIGLASQVGWAGYWVDQTLFSKRFAWQAGAVYPDDGCNLEIFTNARMLELESLGPLKKFEPGEKAELIEVWDLLNRPDQADPNSEEARALDFLLARAH